MPNPLQCASDAIFFARVKIDGKGIRQPLCGFQNRTDLIGAVGDEECLFLPGVGRTAQDGVAVARVKWSPWWSVVFEPQSFGVDGHAAIAADGGAHPLHVVPPWAARDGPQDGFFFRV